jgi:hypothetical protein
MKKVKFEHPAIKYHEIDGNMGFIMVDAKYAVCPRCGGEGHHERDDIDCSRIVDSYHEDGDYEALERYFEGAFDVLCTTCNGMRVVLDPILPEWIVKEIHEYNECMRQTRAEQEAERRMGA